MRHLTALSVLFLSCFVGSPSAFAAKDPGQTARYVAIGDSLAFGFRPDVPLDLANYHGYPQLVSDALNLKVANASCFGETSGHALNLAALDLGCGQWRQNLPLFVNYSGTQIDYAVGVLLDRESTKLVTINLGLNDLGVLLYLQCGGDPECGFNGLTALLGQYAQNMATIFTRIRQTGYSGPIIALNGFAANYADPIQTTAIKLLNNTLATIAAGFGVRVANAYADFETVAAPFGGDICAAGLEVKLPDNTCDLHLSDQGEARLANLVLQLVSKE